MILSEFGIKEPVTSEDRKRIIEKLKKISLSELSNKHEAIKEFEETVKEFGELIERLKATLTKVAPAVDVDTFIKALLTSPFTTNRRDFEPIVQLIEGLENNCPAKNMKETYSEIVSSISVNRPQDHKNKIKIDYKKYLQLLRKHIIPTIAFILTQYMAYQSTVQMNRIEAEQQLQSEQMNRIETEQQLQSERMNRIEAEQQQQSETCNRIEDLLEEFIKQHQVEKIEEPDFIIELDKYSFD